MSEFMDLIEEQEDSSVISNIVWKRFIYLLQLKDLSGSMVVIAPGIIEARRIAQTTTGDKRWSDRDESFSTRLGPLFGGVHIANTVVCKDIDHG